MRCMSASGTLESASTATSPALSAVVTASASSKVLGRMTCSVREPATLAAPAAAPMMEREGASVRPFAVEEKSESNPSLRRLLAADTAAVPSGVIVGGKDESTMVRPVPREEIAEEPVSGMERERVLSSASARETRCGSPMLLNEEREPRTLRVL